jgi:zinc transporter ZupT
MNPVLVQTTIATLAAYFGGSLGALAGNVMARHLRIAIFLSMAVLLSVTVFDILPDAFKLLSLWLFVASVCSGVLLFLLVTHFIGPLCPACVSGSSHGATHAAPLYVILMLVALHSTFDGIALAVSGSINGKIDPVVLSGICVHKIPEGIALALLMIGSGMQPRAAFFGVLAVEFTTEVGGLIGIPLVHSASSEVLGIVFAHVAGGFLYLIGSAVLSNLKSASPLGKSVGEHSDAV